MNEAKTKLAVTGITGKSGMYFLKEVLRNEEGFLKHSKDIRYSTRDDSKAQKIQERAKGSHISFTPFIGDTFDASFVKELCNGCDTLLHIAGIHSSRTVVKAAIEVGIRRIICVHTTGIYSKYKYAGEEYRQTDRIVKDLCTEHNVALTILRPTMIYGNRKDGNVSVFIKMVDHLPIMPTVNGARYELQPVHCKDLGIAYYQVLMNPDACDNHDYNLSGGRPIELRSMFDVIAENLGVKRSYISCPYPIAYAGAWGVYIITKGKKDYREKVQRLVEPRVYSHEDATRDFGYHPVDFEDGVVDEIKMYLKAKGRER